jgi:hypothetical protein
LGWIGLGRFLATGIFLAEIDHRLAWILPKTDFGPPRARLLKAFWWKKMCNMKNQKLSSGLFFP